MSWNPASVKFVNENRLLKHPSPVELWIHNAGHYRGLLPMLSCRLSPPQIAAFIQHRPLRRAAIFCAASSRQNQAERPWMAPQAAAVEVAVEVEAAEV